MFNDGFINIIREEIMKLIKTFISVLFSAFLLFSSTSSFAVEKLHFLIGGGAGVGWKIFSTFRKKIKCKFYQLVRSKESHLTMSKFLMQLHLRYLFFQYVQVY